MAVPSWSSPKVTRAEFLGHHWGVAGVSLVFIAFRIGVRVKYFHRIWADDILIIAAWVMLLATACLYQIQATNFYNHYPLVTGKIPSTPQNLDNERSLLYALVAEFYLFYTTLMCVKLSILLFFRRLFGVPQQAAWQKTWWWFVTGWVVASWAVCLGTIPYKCLVKPLPYIVELCAVPEGINYVWINLQLSCATDIVADVFLISIPIAALWNVQLQTKKKLSLMGILSLAMITILFSIIRIGVMPNKQSSADITWLCLWAHVETGVAVIVSCLASFRQLFTKTEKSSKYSYNSGKTSNLTSDQSGSGSWLRLKNVIPTSQNRSRTVESLPSHHSTENILASKATVTAN